MSYKFFKGIKSNDRGPGLMATGSIMLLLDCRDGYSKPAGNIAPFYCN